MAAVSYLINAGGNLETVVAGTNPPGEDVATITAASPIIVASNTFSVGSQVQFAGSFAAVTGFSTATTYYVIATGLSSTQFELAATPGGTAITPGGASTATPTVFALGAVEIRIDQTANIIIDGSYVGGLRTLRKGEAQALLVTLVEYLIRDINVLEP